MCGFLGWYGCEGPTFESALLESLRTCLRHRGPDDEGLHWGERSSQSPEMAGAMVREAMVHNRLSVIDLSECGHQPMYSEDGRYSIVYNGEIYNYQELRAELETLGHSFRSHSDTEVLLRCYLQWGRNCLERLVGMFAFAVLDLWEGQLFLARDFFGIKPLYYTRWRGGIAFASEIKALLKLPGVDRTANAQRVYQYLRFGVSDHGGDTLFAGIQQLPAAHWIQFGAGAAHAAEPVRYWNLDAQERIDLSFAEAAGRLRELFLDSVRLHLRSDVPVGAALSGGIDSSSIVMAMRLLEPQLEIHSFSFIAEDAAISEERWVDVIGKTARARVHKVRASAEELVRDLDPLIRIQDEPFGSTSIYAQYRVFRRASEAGIKVMLDGQGADELLAGYRPYLAARAASLVRQRRWQELLQFVGIAGREPGMSATFLAMLSLGHLIPPRVQGALRLITGQGGTPRWLKEDWFQARNVSAGSLGYTEGDDVLRNQLIRSTSETSLPHLLRYEDRNSMAWSIESRVPFLTPQLARFLFALPEEYHIGRDGTSKAVFRAAMRGIVPDSVLDRRDKIGFATPELDWVRAIEPFVQATLASEAAGRCPFIDRAAARKEWERVSAGEQPYKFHVWRWLNMVRWSDLLDVNFT